MFCLNEKQTSPKDSLSSSLVSSYYASEILPNYKELIQSSFTKLELKEAPIPCGMEEDPKVNKEIKKKYNFIIPAIVLDIKEGSKILLVKEDLEKFFATFGEVKFIDIQSNDNKAYVLFKYYFSALYAFDTIKSILDISGSSKEEKKEDIKVEIIKDKSLPEANEEPTNKITPIKLNTIKETKCYIPKRYLYQSSLQNFNFFYTTQLSQFQPYYSSILPLYNPDISFTTYSNRDYILKYVCNYSVQIEQEKEFNVTNRIIGPNGCILKRIIYESCIKFNDFSTKVRLRGKGSGYREGDKMVESDEPLQLCVSSLNSTTYCLCCQYIEMLLNRIYYDYYVHCIASGKPEKNLKQISKYEFVVNRY